ncbi:MAG: pH regulation protein F [Rhodobacteraceae bacterium]|nr:pH regulation protein F [Paracoccaceae bacterium]
MTPADFFYWATEAGFTLVMLSLVLGFIRLAKGPSFSDRVVALDMMTVSIVAFCALFAIRSEAAAILDVALVLALIGFLATVALARFAERSMLRQAGDDALAPDEVLHRAATNTPPAGAPAPDAEDAP